MAILTELEKKVAKTQVKLIDFGHQISPQIKAESLKKYAEELAKHYYPRNQNPDYLAPIITSFQVDLATAPRHHAKHYLWKYNYDDLDLLSKFYKLSNQTKKYFHLATGVLPDPTLDTFKKGCEILRLDLGRYAEEIFNIYLLKTSRSRTAKRIVEIISGQEHDLKMNEIFAFADDPSKRNLRAFKGLGKFQYLRKGNLWMALGSAAAKGTIDLRQQDAELFGYSVGLFKYKPVIKVSEDQLELLKAELKDILDGDSSIYYRLKKANNFYREFHFKRRFTNQTQWNKIDFWFNNYTKKVRKNHPKFKWSNYNAAENKFEVTYAPRRTNFFWNPSEELHCDFKMIWNPYS
jgi:hypothetical protein